MRILFIGYFVYEIKRQKEEVKHMRDSIIKTKADRGKNIFPSEAWELISKNRESDDLIIIDVSTPREYKNLHLECGSGKSWLV